MRMPESLLTLWSNLLSVLQIECYFLKMLETINSLWLLSYFVFKMSNSF